LTLQEAKSIARHLGLTLRKVRSGDYRVNFRDGNETTAYYADNLEDAVITPVELARKRASVDDCPPGLSFVRSETFWGLEALPRNDGDWIDNVEWALASSVLDHG